ncbi:MAG: exo-alpha-sialidase [Lachnospiraceae bacterium]|nr:exo-alpha-sialidase [Lachnospiraceae bacterium]
MRKAKHVMIRILLGLAIICGLLPVTGLSAKAEGDKVTITIAEGGNLENANTSRNLAVGPDGSIHIVYKDTERKVQYVKSNKTGAAFSAPVVVAEAGTECEVAVSSTGRVFVAYHAAGKPYIAYSDNGVDFTAVKLSENNANSIHMATDGKHVYAISMAGSTFYYSSDGGETYKTHTGWAGKVYSDVMVDPTTHLVLVLKDDPAITYRVSTDFGENFSEEKPVTYNGTQISVQHSTATMGNGYAYIAGSFAVVYKVDYSNGTAVAKTVEKSSASQGRSISADARGNVVVGYVNADGEVCYQVSTDGGETFQKPVVAGKANAANAAINTKTGDVLFLYNSGNGIVMQKEEGVVEAENLVYNGQPQELVSKSDGATYVTSKSDQAYPTEGWSSEVPTGTNAGTYYVWYKIGEKEPKCVTVIIEKAEQEKPAAPQLKEASFDSITLAFQEGFEYKCGDGQWQSENVFKNLKEETEYTFFQRAAEKANYNVSEESEGASFKTKEKPITWTYTVSGNSLIAIGEGGKLNGKDKVVTITSSVPSLSATEGQKLSDVAFPTDPNGTWEWMNPATPVGEAGVHKFPARFIPKDKNFPAAENIEISVTVTAAVAEDVLEPSLYLNRGLKVTQTGNKLKVKWGKVPGADGYKVYAGYCGKKMKRVKTVNADKSKATIKKLGKKKISPSKNYTVVVKAYKIENGKKKVFAKSMKAFVAGKKTKYTNAKKIKLKKKAYTIKVGKTKKIKAKIVKQNKKKKELPNKYAKKFRYASSDKTVATVSKKGKIKAKKAGTCDIYVYAKNGASKKIKVTVQ